MHFVILSTISFCVICLPALREYRQVTNASFCSWVNSRSREVRWLTRGHTARRGGDGDVSSGSWDSSCPIAQHCLRWTLSPPTTVTLQGQEGARGDGAEEGPGRGDAVPWGPGPGDEAEAHPGRGGAHWAAWAVQEGELRFFFFFFLTTHKRAVCQQLQITNN